MLNNSRGKYKLATCNVTMQRNVQLS